MLLSDTIQTAFNGITVNKNRSMLTMLGIVIGVASVVLMVSLGRSFQTYIITQVESFGTNTIDVFPQGFQKFGGNLDSLVYEDYVSVKQLSTVESVTPIILVSKSVKFGKEEVSPMVMGSHTEIFGNYGLKRHPPDSFHRGHDRHSDGINRQGNLIGRRHHPRAHHHPYRRR
jgi:hypothetical protein